jgi:hypothetical protein
VIIYFKDSLYVIKTLKEFQYVDEDGKDQGGNVRAKAKNVFGLLRDGGRLRSERRTRTSMRERMVKGVGEEGEFDAAARGDENGRRHAGGGGGNDEIHRSIEARKASLRQEQLLRAGADLTWQSDNNSEDTLYTPDGPDSARDAPSTIQIPARLTDDSAMLSNPSSPPEELIHPEDQDTASLGYLENLLASWERRCLLSTVVAPEEDRQGLLKAAEAQITTFLTHILDSRAARRAAQELEESSAQSFVDAIQNVCLSSLHFLFL